MGDEWRGEATVPFHKPCEELPWFRHPQVNAPLRTGVVVKYWSRLPQVQDPSQNGYRTTCVEFPSVRDLDVAVCVSEELCSRVRPSVGAWTCSYANESASWVAVFADVTALILFIEWVYSNNTWEAYNIKI